MITIYEVGAGGYLASTREIDDNAGAPFGFTRTAPPEIPEGHFAVWTDTHWSITDQPYVPPVYAPYVPTILDQILALEATVTNRRIREAALTQEGKDWLADVDAQIAALRAQL